MNFDATLHLVDSVPTISFPHPIYPLDRRNYPLNDKNMDEINGFFVALSEMTFKPFCGMSIFEQAELDAAAHPIPGGLLDSIKERMQHMDTLEDLRTTLVAALLDTEEHMNFILTDILHNEHGMVADRNTETN